MWIETITYRRVKNLGNYQSETLEMTCRLNPDDILEECFAKLKDKVMKALELPPEDKRDNPF